MFSKTFEKWNYAIFKREIRWFFRKIKWFNYLYYCDFGKTYSDYFGQFRDFDFYGDTFPSIDINLWNNRVPP